MRGFLLYDLAQHIQDFDMFINVPIPDNEIEESIRSFDKVLELDPSHKLASQLKAEAEKLTSRYYKT
jgi:hypothetical protein